MTNIEPYRDTLAYLGLDPARPEVRALVLLANRYRLDPLLGHVEIISPKKGRPRPYITRDGLLDVAHRSGQLDGIVVDEERRSSADDGWTAYVSVWRKDMGHPFRYGAQCKDDEPQAEQRNGPEMALARAERRALKRAFNISADDDTDIPMPAGPHHDHTIVEDDGTTMVCSCGEKFAAGGAYHKHRTEIAGPAGGDNPPAAQRALGGAPAGPATYKSRKQRPVETGPPVDYYDNLPEARNMR